MTNTFQPHITVASVIEQQGKFLLVQERTREGKLVYNQPAGHLEDNETVFEAVIRETQEETGFAFQPTAIVGIYYYRLLQAATTFQRIAFVGEFSAPTVKPILDTDIVDTVWLSYEEILAYSMELRNPMVLACINDYLLEKRFPLNLIQTLAS